MNETNSTMMDITVMGNASKIDYKKLPEVAYFKVQSRGATGTLKDLHDRKVGAWALLVSCKDGKGLRLMTDVAYEFGMKIKGEFKTREEAIEAGKKAVEKWGKLTATVEKKVKKSKSIEELIGEMTAEAKQELIKKLMAA